MIGLFNPNPLAWPIQNRRRWELLPKKVRQGLTDAEAQDLARLQQRTDEELARVGPGQSKNSNACTRN